MSDALKVVIDRKRWLRGEGTARSRLLRPEDGKMCCIGFVAKAAGVEDVEMKDKSALASVAGVLIGVWPILRCLQHLDSGGVLQKAYSVNDYGSHIFYPGTKEAEASREARIVELLAKANIHVTFEG